MENENIPSLVDGFTGVIDGAILFRKSYDVLYDILTRINEVSIGIDNLNNIRSSLYIKSHFYSTKSDIKIIYKLKEELIHITLWNSIKYRDDKLINKMNEIMDDVFRDVINVHLIRHKGYGRDEKIALDGIECPFSVEKLITLDLVDIIRIYTIFKSTKIGLF